MGPCRLGRERVRRRELRFSVLRVGSENYYRTGQAAKQLDASSYQIRRLCECGLIDAELTSGKQWRIPASEVIRLKREGVPPIPQLLPEPAESMPTPVQREGNGHLPEPEDPEDEEPGDLYVSPSEEIIRSAEEVTITENLIKKAWAGASPASVWRTGQDVVPSRLDP